MPHPTAAEQAQHEIRSHKSVELGLGQVDSCTAMATELAKKYPNHLVLIQAGGFLHGYDRTAYALHTLKKYKLRLVGTIHDPHLCVGFQVANHKRRLWKLFDDFGIPYVVALGSQAKGHTIYESEQPRNGCQVLVAVSDNIVQQVISDLAEHKKVNSAVAVELLKNPDQSTFLLKAKVLELDTHLLYDIHKLSRDLRSTYGENLRECMGRILRSVMLYGKAENKLAVLRDISADVDVLKHYLTQPQKLNKLEKAFEHRVVLAVEIGRLVGSLINKATP